MAVTFHLWLRAPVEHPRIFRVDHLRPDAHIHWFRITRPDDLDAGLRRLLCASYEVGASTA